MQPKELSCMQVWGGNQPTLSTFEKAGADIWLYSRPYDQSHGGGDTYYLSSCASGRITRMLLADISGHGQSASAVAISLRDLMRKHINQIFPNKLFEKINGEFTVDQSNDRFATAILHSYFAPTRKLRICNAGHPPPFVYRQNTKKWTKVELPTQAKLQDLPFGITENSDYQEFEIDLQVNDTDLFNESEESENLFEKPIDIDNENSVRKENLKQYNYVFKNKNTTGDSFQIIKQGKLLS